MIAQTIGKIKIYALAMVGLLILAAIVGFFRRVVAIVMVGIVLEIVFVVGFIVWNDFKSGGMIRRRP